VEATNLAIWCQEELWLMSSRIYAHNPATLLHIATYLRQRGISALEIFRRVGISPSMLLDATGWVSRDLCLHLVSSSPR
jgi:hypothetical protein